MKNTSNDGGQQDLKTAPKRATSDSHTVLSEQKCMACEGSVSPFSKAEAGTLGKQIPSWNISFDAKSITRRYGFKDFTEALTFVNKVGALAQSEGHHPDICLKDYKFVELTVSTHAIGGLSQNDFILAAKIDA